MKKRELLYKISDQSISQMLPCYKPIRRHFAAGDVILTYEGNTTMNIMVVESGTAKLSTISEDGDLFVLEHYETGDIFGELFALPLESLEYIVTAETDCSIIYIDYLHIITPCEELCTHHSQFISNLFIMTAQKTQELSLHISILHQPTTRLKILSYLKYISSGVVKKRDDGSFVIPITLTELSEYLGVDRAAMMREIKAMKQAGLIESNKQEFKVLV